MTQTYQTHKLQIRYSRDKTAQSLFLRLAQAITHLTKGLKYSVYSAFKNYDIG